LKETVADVKLIGSELYNHALVIEMVEDEEAEFKCSPAEDWLDR